MMAATMDGVSSSSEPVTGQVRSRKAGAGTWLEDVGGKL